MGVVVRNYDEFLVCTRLSIVIDKFIVGFKILAR